MKFKLSRRTAHCTKFVPHNEKDGDKKKPTVDIYFTCQGGKRDLDMFVPMMEGKFSDSIYEGNALLVPHLSPLTIHRNPEGIEAKIWDEVTKRTSPMSFANGNVQKIKAYMENKHKHAFDFMLAVEIDPDKDAPRLHRLVDNDCEIELVASQDDLFQTDEEDDDGEEGEQGELVGEEEDDDDDE